MQKGPLLLLTLLAVGCAKEAVPPPSVGTPPVATEPPTALDASGAPTASTEADASPLDAAPTASGVPEPVKVDECAPVAAAFESSLRPKLKKCWLDAANKKPNERIIGSVRYLIEIDGLGKVATMKQVEKSELPDGILKCMMKTLKAEPLDSAKCPFKTLTIAEKFPR